MNRPPYPARVVAGLLVTCFEESRKIPTLVFTLPMTAVSQTLQAGMRLQQGIAELAIKGDEVLSPLMEKPSEHPEWARFDEDELPKVADRVTIKPVEDSHRLDAKAAESAAEQIAAKQAEDKAAQKKEKNAEQDVNGSGPEGTEATGRFALYSSPPVDLVAAEEAPNVDDAELDAGDDDSVVGRIGYDDLTLAQLRAKLRTLSVDDLTELSAYEKANRARTPFQTMLDNRIASQSKS